MIFDNSITRGLRWHEIRRISNSYPCKCLGTSSRRHSEVLSLTAAFRCRRGNLGLRYSGCGFRKDGNDQVRPRHFPSIDRSISNAGTNSSANGAAAGKVCDPNSVACRYATSHGTTWPRHCLSQVCAASRIVRAPLGEFANAKFHLGDLFSACEVAMCDDMLAAAQTSEERISGVQSFLLRHLRPHADSLANRAARHLRQHPTMQMHSLAARLGSSPRHLSRAFKAVFGISPKRFSRLARFQKILAARRTGGSWAQVAQACGLTDQAHLVDEFRDIVGESPTDFFTRELRTGAEAMEEANLIIQTRGRSVTKS